jgi:hypothetical protein
MTRQRTSHDGLLALILALAFASGCGGTSSATADGGHEDGGHDAATDAKADSSDSSDATPIRVATTRGLLPTSVQNLLLDPFVTYDESWGHFDQVDPVTDGFCAPIVREILSQSPVGVAGAVAKVSVQGHCTEILAPFPGAAKGSASAEMWISLSDATGAPLPFPSAHDLDGVIKVELLPNYLPSQTPQTVYPLEVVSASPIAPSDGGPLPVTIAGRQWGLVAASRVSLPQGGWFVITLVNPTDSFYLAGAEVVASDLVSLARPRARLVTDGDRASTKAYGEVVRRLETPRRSLGAR